VAAGSITAQLSALVPGLVTVDDPAGSFPAIAPGSDGATIFDGLATPGFSPTVEDMLAFSAFTGGLSEEVLIDDVTVTRDTPVSAQVGAGKFRFALGSNAPNPFHARTTLHFELPASRPVSLVVYDVTGRRVRELADGVPYPAGRNSVVWDGTDDGGRRVASGVYFYRLQAGGSQATGRAIRLR